MQEVEKKTIWQLKDIEEKMERRATIQFVQQFCKQKLAETDKHATETHHKLSHRIETI